MLSKTEILTLTELVKKVPGTIYERTELNSRAEFSIYQQGFRDGYQAGIESARIALSQPTPEV